MTDIELAIKVDKAQKQMVDDFMELPPQVENDLISAIRHGTSLQKALEQEPCDDAISRKAVIEAIEDDNRNGLYSCFASDNDAQCFKDVIRKLQPVNPKEPRWIPVSERLPEENKSVIASTELGVFSEARYSKEYGWEWAYEAGADYWRNLEDTGDTVTAWMPLPKKYEPQEVRVNNGIQSNNLQRS